MGVLDTVPFFDSLQESDRQHLSYFCQKQEIPKGQVLFSQWDEPNAFYVVVSGAFSVHQDTDGVVKELGPVMPWDILWEMALFWDNEKRNATVAAKEDSSVITILDFSIKELAKNNPEILEKIQKVIQDRT